MFFKTTTEQSNQKKNPTHFFLKTQSYPRTSKSSNIKLLINRHKLLTFPRFSLTNRLIPSTNLAKAVGFKVLELSLCRSGWVRRAISIAVKETASAGPPGSMGGQPGGRAFDWPPGWLCWSEEFRDDFIKDERWQGLPCLSSAAHACQFTCGELRLHG